MKTPQNTQEKMAPLIIALTLISYALSYLLQSYLAKQLGSNFYGEYTLAWQTLVLLGVLALLGSNTASTRYLASFLQLHQNVDALSYIKWNIQFVRRSFLICWAIGILFFVSMLLLHVFHVHDLKQYHLIIYMFWVAPLLASIYLLSSFLLANNNFILSTILQGVLFNLVFLICFFVAFHLWSPHFSSFKISLVLMTSLLMLTIMCLICVIRKIQTITQIKVSDILFGKIEKHPDWRSTSYKLAVTQLSFFVMTACVFFILQAVLKSHQQVGYFSAGVTISTILFVVGFAITVPLRPLISSLCSSTDGKTDLQHKVNVANLIFVLVLTPLMILLLLFSKLLLTHFGNDFVAALPSCIILIFSEFVFSFTLIGQAILSYSGYANDVMVIKLVTVSAALIGGVFATIFFGLVGMAYATLAFSSINLLLVCFFCRKRLALRSLSIF